MKYLLLLIPFLSLLASDEIFTPSPNQAFVKLDDVNYPFAIAYTTDGSGNLRTIAGDTVTDQLLVPEGSGKAYLKDNEGELYPAMVFYSTDGEGNIEPLSDLFVKKAGDTMTGPLVITNVDLTKGGSIRGNNATDGLPLDELLTYPSLDNIILMGNSVNTNGVGVLNSKYFKAQMASGLAYLDLAGADSSNNVILSSPNANTTKLMVGGLEGTPAVTINNGGNVFVNKQMRIGQNNNTIFGGDIDIISSQSDGQDGTAGIGLASYRNTDEWGSFVYGVRYRGTYAAPATVQTGDVLMEYGGLGWDGTNALGGGELMWTVDGTVSSGVIPSKVELTVTDTTGASKTALKIDSSLITTLLGPVKTPTFQLGTIDPYGNSQIWDYGTNSKFRMGSLVADGDATGDISSEGMVFYGQNVQGDVMHSDGGDANFAYARIKPTRFGIYNSTTAGGADYIWRVDGTSLYLKDNSFNKTFEVVRSTGNVNISGALTGTVNYTPAVSGNWISPVPTTVSNALDSLALNKVNQSQLISTDKYYVDGDIGNDTTAATFGGDQGHPFKTIQACLNYLGQPISRVDALRHISIYISSKAATVGSLFSGIYEENLTVPNRFITMFCSGCKIGNDTGSGYGNILKEYSASRRFGASSSEFRPTLSLVGLTETRDSHSRIRTGFHVGGTNRTSIIKRTVDSIQGNGSNTITVHITSGQFTYPILVSNYPTDPYIRIAVQGTTNYNATYDITSKVDDSTFVATRISGTNTHTEVETSGTFFESDSAGASGLSHDAVFINVYQQGAYTCDDGTVNSGAPTAGTEVLYSKGSRWYTGIEGRTINLQRWEDTTLAGTNTVSAIAGMMNVSLAGTLLTSTFTYSTDDMGWVNCRFNSAVPITVSSSGQTVRMDAMSYSSFLSSGSSWVTNTPTVSLLDNAKAVGYTPTTSAQWSTVPTTVQGALDSARVLSQSSAAPTCSSTHRGLMWLVQGGTGVADTLQVCMKDASDNYSWVTK